ncbi:MAG: hypothetical protein DCC56_02945 [Anaerolineae bacterium]|nr:MAG: hypothetical protein DCC56_02945 [Anaerolineae bacterium]WKZ44206.1 MAG: site-specific integrase [Anaerolineales bacterium]
MNNEIETFLASHPYSDSTKDSYRRILAALVSVCNLAALDAAQLIQFITRPGWGNAQQNVALFCVKKFLKWKFGALHPALAAKIPRIKSTPRRSLDPDKALQVLASFNTHTASGARDLALVALGLDTGFRRQELGSLRLADIDLDSNTAKALCKGAQWGYAVFSIETAHLIQHWLKFRKPADGVGNLFVNIKTGKALTGNGIACIFKRLSKSIGFKISAHDLRSSFATLSTIYGMPSRTAQKAGRWSSIEMVEHYTGNLELESARPFLPMANLKR